MSHNPPIKLRQRCLIDRGRASGPFLVRKVEWLTDGYVMVRADALRSVPKDSGVLRNIESRIGKHLHTLRGAGDELTDSGVALHGGSRGEVRLLQFGCRYVPVNAKAAAEWLAHPWHSVTQAGASGPIEFRELRRGRPVLVGAVMPVRLAHGNYISEDAA